MTVQSVPQQVFLWELAGGRDRALVLCPAYWLIPGPQEGPSSLDILDLLLCFPDLLLQGFPLWLTGDTALLLL